MLPPRFATIRIGEAFTITETSSSARPSAEATLTRNVSRSLLLGALNASVALSAPASVTASPAICTQLNDRSAAAGVTAAVNETKALSSTLWSAPAETLNGASGAPPPDGDGSFAGGGGLPGLFPDGCERGMPSL